MKRFLPFIILLITNILISQEINPCEDSRYLDIKEKSLDEMSDREYQYFLKKDNECSEYMRKYSGTADSPTNTTNNKVEEIDSKSVKSLVDQNSKMLAYETSKKDPAFAGILAFLIPSAGHAYAGNWENGVVLLLARFGLAIVAFSGLDVGDVEEPIKPTYWLGLGGVFVLGIFEVIDAMGEAKKYNSSLAKKIFGEDSPIVLANEALNKPNNHPSRTMNTGPLGINSIKSEKTWTITLTSGLVIRDVKLEEVRGELLFFKSNGETDRRHISFIERIESGDIVLDLKDKAIHAKASSISNIKD